MPVGGWSPIARETIEILRDPIRLAFAFLGSALLMVVFGFGITTDVENIRFASFDHDQTPGEPRLPRASIAGRHTSSGSRRSPILSDRGTSTAAGATERCARDRDPAELRGATCEQGAVPRSAAYVDGAQSRSARETTAQYVEQTSQRLRSRPLTTTGIQAAAAPVTACRPGTIHSTTRRSRASTPMVPSVTACCS